MADINIAIPGASEAALKAALGALVGQVLIDSGEISSPVEYLDIALPAGYDHYILRMSQFICNVPDNPSAAVSTDGGATFYCDPEELDTYGISYLAQQSLTPTTARGQYSAGDDSLIDWRASGDAGSITDYNSIIWPGDATHTFRIRTQYHSLSPDIANINVYDWLTFLNIGATITPTLARINLIRLLPYGNGDCDPPTSGNTLTAGTWFLFGVLAP